MRTLIQELIDANVEPEEFCDRLERLLNASPQPCLIGFLKVRLLLKICEKSLTTQHTPFLHLQKSLPLLRQSLVMKELVIEGIKPPPHHIAFTGTITPNIPVSFKASKGFGMKLLILTGRFINKLGSSSSDRSGNCINWTCSGSNGSTNSKADWPNNYNTTYGTRTNTWTNSEYNNKSTKQQRDNNISNSTQHDNNCANNKYATKHTGLTTC